MYELYLEMGVYAFLNLRNLQFSNKEGLITSIFAFAGMSLISLYPAISFNLLMKNSKNFKDHEFHLRMGTLIEGTRIKENTIMPQLHFPVFLFRRHAYILILIIGIEYPTMQITLCVLKTLAMLGFLIFV